MELSDILTLVKAGFTKDEIAQMVPQNSPISNPEPDPVSIPSQVPEPEPAPDNEPVAVAVPDAQPAPAPVPAQAEGQPSISDVMKSIAQLTSAIQANAIQTSFIPGGNPNQPDAAATLAEIIRPSRKKKEV